MRRPGLFAPDGLAGREATVIASLGGHLEFRGKIADAHWTDPFLPESAVEAGINRVDPPTLAASREEESTTHHMRNPFDESRLGAKLDLPVPQTLTLSRDGALAPVVMAPDEACVADWEAGLSRKSPPDLECFRRVAQTRRLAKSDAYNFAKTASLFLSNPIFGHIIDNEMKAVSKTRAVHVAWAAAWLEWVAEDEGRMVRALASLDDRERGTLRRRLWRWWLNRRLGPYHQRITRLYEQHFLALYPEARGRAGMPKRRFFRDTWLWATNWFAEADRRSSGVVIAAYDALSAKDRAVIDGFVADTVIADRFPQTIATLSNRPASY